MNIAARLEHWAREIPERVALRCEDHELTFQDLDALAGSIAGGLRAAGIEPGDRVALLSGSNHEFVACLYGIWKLGGIAVLINMQLTAGDVADQVDRSGAVLLLVEGQDEARRFAQDVSELTELAPRVLQRTECQGDLQSARVLAGGEIATIAFTSGTTGMPKGTAHSHDALIAQTRMLAVHYSASPEDRLLSLLPLYLLSIVLVGPMLAIEIGTSCRILRRYGTEEFLRVAKEDRPTIAAAVPVFFYDLIDLPEDARKQVDLSSFRIISCGGAPLAPHVRMTFEEQFDLRFVQAYGSTEAPGIIATDPIVGERRFESVGAPLPHIHIDIEAADGSLLEAHQVGEVCVRAREEGPYAGVYKPLSSYWNMPDETEASLAHGRHHLGDMGYLDEDGFLFLVDRKNDVIIRGGMNVYPMEIELLLTNFPEVVEAAVVGQKHERYGEVPVAFVRAEEVGGMEADELRQRANSSLAKYKHLEALSIVDDFPRNALGKVLKRELAGRRAP